MFEERQRMMREFNRDEKKLVNCRDTPLNNHERMMALGRNSAVERKMTRALKLDKRKQ